MKCECNIKRWVFAGLGAFATIFLLETVVHGFMLMDAYEATVSVWRPQEQASSMYWMMNVGQLLFGLVFACFYTKGYEPEKPGLGQGLRFGIYAGLLLVAAQNLVWYVVLPIPFSLNLAWLVSAFVNCVAAGAVVGLIYKN